MDAAIKALGRAVELDPSLDKREDVVALRAKLRGEKRESRPVNRWL